MLVNAEHPRAVRAFAFGRQPPELVLEQRSTVAAPMPWRRASRLRLMPSQ